MQKKDFLWNYILKKKVIAFPLIKSRSLKGNGLFLLQ